ncbi:MAG: polymerase [Solirubrobacterales bacterium]|nr:polymerase [Solirubrobacterales bacterium]
MSRCVAHLDMDAFYVSVELQRHPELRGLPVVVSGSGPRAVVTTASYEARRYGVQSATPASRARRLCPDAVFVAPDFAAYRETSARVMAIVRDHAERVEVVGLDEAYVDLTGMAAPRAAMRQLVVAIADATGLACSVGIGPNKLVAKVASDAEKPRGFVVLSREEACARFAGAPPALVPGIGPKTAARLDAMGIGTLRDLGAAPANVLAERFGARLGPELQARARFEHDGAVTEERAVISESRETTFDEDIADPAELERILGDLTVRLCEDLARRGRRGRTIGIKIRLDDFSTHTRSRTLPEAVNELSRIGTVARDLLRDFGVPRPLRLLGVRVAGLEEAQADQLALPL